ncbi:unnamed protein product, partial [Polarella glacialis]
MAADLTLASHGAAVREALTGASGSHDPLTTLTSGQRKEVKGGSLQAHICVITNPGDVSRVMQAFRAAAAFQSVASWSFAWRLLAPEPSQTGLEEVKEHEEMAEGFGGVKALHEASEDGLDEGSGQKILSVLRRSHLQGLLLVMSRWQDYGATPGLELFGTGIYPLVVERCKDLIANLKKAMGLSEEQPLKLSYEERPPLTKNFSFTCLPPRPEPV